MTDHMHYLVQRHEERMESARQVFGDRPICPDCYLPLDAHDILEGTLQCEGDLFWAITAEM